MIQAQHVPGDVVQADTLAHFLCRVVRHRPDDCRPRRPLPGTGRRKERGFNLAQPVRICIGLAADHHAIDAGRKVRPHFS